LFDSEVSTLLVGAPAERKAWPSLTALALGGFGIGTTEFATMGVLPDTSPAAVGALLAVAGVAVMAISRRVERATVPATVPAQVP
jgi:DHA1 family inner membrane transport protein